jgi:hypothetical protein
LLRWDPGAPQAVAERLAPDREVITHVLVRLLIRLHRRAHGAIRRARARQQDEVRRILGHRDRVDAIALGQRGQRAREEDPLLPGLDDVARVAAPGALGDPVNVGVLGLRRLGRAVLAGDAIRDDGAAVVARKELVHLAKAVAAIGTDSDGVDA